MSIHATAFEESGIRFIQDIPVVIPCLEQALTLFSQQDDDPYAFQTLIYFFSSLLWGPDASTSVTDRNLTAVWHIRRVSLNNPYGFFYGNIHTCTQVDAVIDQLDPITTFRQLQQYSQTHLQGIATSRPHHFGEEYTFVNRGHDWILRCAYELDISDKLKTWLQLMYEKQPYKILDLPNPHFDPGDDIFLSTLNTAASIGGFDAMISVTKLWIRQALTIVKVWGAHLQAGGDYVQEALMPPYEWCVVAYEKMWHRFKNEVRNPLSEYPYTVRQQLLLKVHFKRIFEKCWGWTVLSTRGINTRNFSTSETRAAIFSYVLSLAQEHFQPRNFSAEEVDIALGIKAEENGRSLLAEGPVVSVDNLADDLRVHRTFYDGLCAEFYPPFPIVALVYADDFFDESDDFVDDYVEGFEDENIEDEDSGSIWEGAQPIFFNDFETFNDIETEAFGPRVDVSQCTRSKEPDAGDFCVICQEDIASGQSNTLRCVVPVTCSHIFHAECLDAWVNSAALICNKCPYCKT